MLSILVMALVSVRAQDAPSEMWVLDLNSLKVGAEASLESRRRAWDELQAVSALQGIVNRDKPRLYVLMVGDGGRTDLYWLNRLNRTWAKGWSQPKLRTVEAAVTRFRQNVDGVVVWDERVPATSNVASTISGVENLIPVRYDRTPGSLFEWLTENGSGPKLPVKRWLIGRDGKPIFTGRGVVPGTQIPSSGSAKDDAYLWAISRYLQPGKCKPGFMAYYPDAFWLSKPRDVPLERTLLTNHDFGISHRAFFFDLGPWEDEAADDDPGQLPGSDHRTLLAVLRAAYALGSGRITQVMGFTPWDQKYTDHTGQKHDGVATEWHYAEILSNFNAFMDADAPGLHAMANASVFAHEPLQSRYVQKNRQNAADLRKAGYLRSDGSVVPKAYVTVYVGDYDSAAWLYEMMPTVWDDPARGSVPLGWAFNPALAERFPTGLAYARETATANDFFVSGDSGAGYLNPGSLQPPRRFSGLPSGLSEWERYCSAAFHQWDLGIAGFIIDGNAPGMDEETKRAYARFSPDGVVAQKVPPLSLVDGTPFLRMGPDLPGGNVQAAAKVVEETAPRTGPSFSIFRTILWTPSDHKRMFDLVRQARPDVAIVDPYTLMELARRSAAVR